MHHTEDVSPELLQEFLGGEIVIANGKPGVGGVAVRGVLIEATLIDEGWLSVKYTCDEYAFTTLDDADSASWYPSSGDVTHSLLHSEIYRGDNELHLSKETPQGSVARLTAPIPSVQAA